uniref:Ig-like domain-containing protein n=1 Tax=Fundulus heteroclitus TaxID=8078 RepID=A0A3Q2QWP2_FUNHE
MDLQHTTKILSEPASLTVQPGQALRISCQVSYSVNTYTTTWVRQPAGKALEWMGAIWSGGSTYYANSVQGRIEITRDTSKNIVNLRQENSLNTEDSAIYYCARVLQRLKSVQQLYKNLQCLLSYKTLAVPCDRLVTCQGVPRLSPTDSWR